MKGGPKIRSKTCLICHKSLDGKFWIHPACLYAMEGGDDDESASSEDMYISIQRVRRKAELLRQMNQVRSKYVPRNHR